MREASARSKSAGSFTTERAFTAMYCAYAPGAVIPYWRWPEAMFP